MKVALIVPAAGSGIRLGRDCPKALVEIAGKPLLCWTLERLAASAEFVETIVLAAPDCVQRFERAVAGSAGTLGTLRVLAGGATRQRSVAIGVAALGEAADLVCVHDAARPLVDAATVRKAIDAAADSGAATVASRPSDSVRQDEGDGRSAALDRARLWLVETPQVFRRELLQRAHREAAGRDGSYTDDASMVEAIGHGLQLVASAGRNLKVTLPQDLLLAEAVLVRPDTPGVT